MGDESCSIYDDSVGVKICFLGDSSVGKTSIINVIQGKGLTTDQMSTIGAAFYIRKIKVDGDHMVKLHIWDTAGQERFRALTTSYYRDAEIIFLVYAINSETSFLDLDTFIESINDNCISKPQIYILGNKSDLESERTVTAERGQAYATSINAEFSEVSAANTTDLIISIIDETAIKYVKSASQNHKSDKKLAIADNDQNTKKKKCC
ncbi:Ras family protein [Trichomonas vaginalis G3]|uniref:Ras family protein n=1 Tax=Trichomonas vaginalis (strain ATCC PRA-98 / G3) TaxID=412133 RepID=A2EGH0_TRIV3|nr:Ras family protein [Trichomonas vaginalis G3]|eukprot:XP_001320476.1 Ras family protein [Trichomonas vaginalis G3]